MPGVGCRTDRRKSEDLADLDEAPLGQVVDLFEGQPTDADALETKLQGALLTPDGQTAFDIAAEVGAVGNNLLLDDEAATEP